MRLTTIAFTTVLLSGLLFTAQPASAEKVPFDITLVSNAGVPLQTLSDAQNLLAYPSAPAILFEAHNNELHFANSNDEHFGPFGRNNPFPITQGFDSNNFALQTTALLYIPTAGAWTFGVASDDGFSMTVDGQTFEHAGRRAARTTLQVINVPAAGNYPIQVTYFQHLDRAELEVFAAPGTHSHMGPRQGFHLINGNAFEALKVVDSPSPVAADPPPSVGSEVPEPTTFSLLGVSMTMLLLRRRREARAIL